MTNESIKVQLVKEISEFIKAIEFVPVDGKNQLNKSSHHLLSMNFYQIEGEAKAYHPMISAKKCDYFFTTITGLLDGKVGVSQIVKTINQLTKVWNQENVSDIAEKTAEKLLYYYSTSSIAYIPLSNLSIRDYNLKIPLAHAMLYSGGKNSPLFQATRSINELYSEAVLKEDDTSPILIINAQGDPENAKRIVFLEARNALSVLRFITGWLISFKMGQKITQLNGRMNYNSATSVKPSSNSEKSKILLVYKDLTSFNQINTRTDHVCIIQKSNIDYAYKYYGLEDINYHFHNQQNPISQRIIRALQMYDSGVLAQNRWQSFYRYVVSVDILTITGDNKTKIKLFLEKLIKYGGHFVGEIRKNEHDEEENPPETITWEEFSDQTTTPYESFYRIRNDILHHNKLVEPTELETNNARILAHNAIRLAARLAREFDWKTEKEAIKWFNKPIPIPK